MGEFMEGNGQIDFLTDEQLLSFFHRKKTEISCIAQPHMLLTQLRDHDLLPEKLFKKVNAMHAKQKGVYEVLDCLEKERPQQIRHFWRCVFEDHMVQNYTTLLLLQKSLPDAVTKFSGRLREKSGGKGKNGSRSKNTRKRNRDDRSSEESDGPGPSSTSSRTRKKPVKKTPSSSPKTGNKNMWMLSKYKTELPIKCGDKEGILHRDKLAKGEECILSQERWFTPSEFEKFAGREKSKNWKLSIYCGNTPLKTLIEDNHLQCPSPVARKRTCVRKRKKQISVSSSESSSPDSETSSSSEEDSESEDFQEQTRRAGGRSQCRSRVDEDDDDEEEEEVADLTVFQAQTLPVTSASLTGTLYKKRFKSGSHGKSIRTEERWFTPEEFVKKEQTLTAGLWTRDILCHGKTLNFLIKKTILQIHPLKCKCRKCKTQPKLMEQNNDDECYACHSGGDLVCCDECPRAFHSDCHLPVVYEEDSPGEWVCTFCDRTRQQCPNMTEQEASDAPVSQYLLQCRYLLLCMYKEDMQRVFVKDPRRTVERYAEFISRPMWLDRIKDKLESNKYQKVGEFVSDFRLIIDNSSKFNQDNKFGRLSDRLTEIFQKEMQKIFSTQPNTQWRSE